MLRRLMMGTLFATGISLAAVSTAPADPINLTIGKLLELTGPLSETGPSQDKAIKLAIDYANKAAAAAGVDIKAADVGADVQGDPQAALSAARALVAKGASCLIGPSITPESIAIANGLTIQKKITIWPVGTSMRLRTIKDEGTIFRTVPPDSLQALALVAGIIDKLGTASGKLVSIAYRNEPYGEGLAKDFKAAWEAKGGKTQGPVVFDPNQATFDSEAGEIVANNPDAYVIIDYPDTFAKLGASLVRTGKFDATKLFVPDALAFSTVPGNIPAQAIEGARGTRGGTPTDTDAYKVFDKLWETAGGAEHFSLDANSFDSTTLCMLAAVAGKSADPAAIQEHVRAVTTPGAPKFYLTTLSDAFKAVAGGEKIDYVGVAGAFEFAANGDPTISRFDIFEYRAGKLAVLKQIDAAK
ncbi:MAG: ABC transporter substrate-binding protein [Methylobacteriaceae bacterium]|nr:ABC transporter substrate-binding protein [Methylobacteriaceae bacterium]